MLLIENEPFADAHIENLKSVATLIESFKTSYHTGIATGITLEDLEDATKKLDDAQHGFYRYKVCFADEVKMKIQRTKQYLNLRDSTKE